MAILGSLNLIRAFSVLHIAFAYLLLTTPQAIADHNVVNLMGESMRFPHPPSFNKPSPTLSFAALLLSFIGVSDLIASLLPEPIAFPHFATQAPVRCSFLFLVNGYITLTKPGGLLAGGLSGAGKTGNSKYVKGAGDTLKNDVVFAWAFMELGMWFWVYVSLRDEQAKLAQKEIDRRAAEEDRL